MKAILSITILVIFFLSYVPSIFSQEEKKVKIEWESIPGVKQYKVEIRDSNEKIVVSQKVSDTFAHVELKVGNYEKRLTLYNKMDEVITESKWSALLIVEVKDPVLDDPSQKVNIKKSDKLEIFSITGKNFAKEIRVILRSPVYSIRVRDREIKDDSKIVIQENISQLPVGQYDLCLKNPNGSEIVFPKYLTVEKETRTLDFSVRTFHVFYRSLAFPGWGQYYAGEKENNASYTKRSYYYWIGLLVPALVAIPYYNEYKNEINRMESLNKTNLKYLAIMPSYLTRAVSMGAYITTTNQERVVRNKRTNFKNMQALLLGVYFINLIDAIYIETKLTNKTLVRLSVSPFYDSELRLQFVHKF